MSYSPTTSQPFNVPRVLAYEIHLGEDSVQHQHQINRMQTCYYPSEVVDIDEYDCPQHSCHK